MAERPYEITKEEIHLLIGNGRVGRLLAVLMALQAGLPGLDFTGIRGKMRKSYFAAVQASANKDYEPMKRVFSAVLSRTRRTLAK